MKCTLSTQAYKWKSLVGAWSVGRLVEHRNEFGSWWVTTDAGAISPAGIKELDLILLAHSHTHELEFVRWGDLEFYGPPGEPPMLQPGTPSLDMGVQVL